jgi:GH15 family glucan-1,4-alpha-glucosidase
VQLDVYGELLNSLYVYRERLGALHPEIQAFAADLADAAARRWREPDSGIWEMRGLPRHHLSSKVLCWVALDRAVRLAPQLGDYAKVAQWEAARDEIRAAVVERGWSERRGAFAQSFDSDELDAAALLMPILGFLPATDERMRATIEAIARNLIHDELVLRYRSDEGLNEDRLTGREGTFVICSFWLASCLAKAGELERAEALFDRLLENANDLGLLAEEIDTGSGEQLGKLPAGLQPHRPDHRGLGDRQGKGSGYDRSLTDARPRAANRTSDRRQQRHRGGDRASAGRGRVRHCSRRPSA